MKEATIKEIEALRDLVGAEDLDDLIGWMLEEGWTTDHCFAYLKAKGKNLNESIKIVNTVLRRHDNYKEPYWL